MRTQGNGQVHPQDKRDGGHAERGPSIPGSHSHTYFSEKYRLIGNPDEQNLTALNETRLHSRILRLEGAVNTEADLVAHHHVVIVLAERGAGKTDLLQSLREARSSTVSCQPFSAAVVVDSLDEVARIPAVSVRCMREALLKVYWMGGSMRTHSSITYSGMLSNLCGLSCITYSFSMWYDSLINLRITSSSCSMLKIRNS